MRSKNYGINVRVTEQEKQKLLENARFCSLTLSEYLRRLAPTASERGNYKQAGSSFE